MGKSRLCWPDQFVKPSGWPTFLGLGWFERRENSKIGHSSALFWTSFTHFYHFLRNYWTDLEDISTVVLVVERATQWTQNYTNFSNFWNFMPSTSSFFHVDGLRFWKFLRSCNFFGNVLQGSHLAYGYNNSATTSKKYLILLHYKSIKLCSEIALKLKSG